MSKANELRSKSLDELSSRLIELRKNSLASECSWEAGRV